MATESGKSGPGKSQREGISVVRLAEMFPNEGAANEWLEMVIWPDGCACPR